ncbi:hypothetical protein Sj15T_32490 [Sphingobium sp. TA15]|nr:hypothetical protein Sj15T_32490 [Sphingobium sp. TA15]
MQTRIHYVSAPAGSGKTYQLEQLAAKLATSENHKILIAQPTRHLIRQTAANLRRANPALAVKSILSSSNGDAVTPRIEAHMANAGKGKGQVLLISHEALKRLPPAHRAHWDLFVDEIPSVFECLALKIVKTHAHLTDHIELEDLGRGISAVKISPGHRGAVEILLRNESKDELLERFGPISNHLLDDSRTVMVETACYQALLDGTKREGEINFFSILGPEFVQDFNSVTLMGANARETELFALWGIRRDIDFVPHPLLTKGLRYHEHQNGDRLTVHYLFEREWSISRSQTENDDTGMTLLEEVGDYIQRFFAGQRFLWVANKSADMMMFDRNDRLPAVSHGLNEPHFIACHAVASTIALVHNHASAKFLAMLGLTDSQIRTVICYQSEYQAIMRCSLRDPDAIAPVIIIVPSRASAEWIAGKFAGAAVSKLSTGLDWEVGKVGRPKAVRAMTNAERVRKHRAAKKGGGGLTTSERRVGRLSGRLNGEAGWPACYPHNNLPSSVGG